MAEVLSTRTLALGQAAPGFRLPDPQGQLWGLDEMRGSRGLVVAFVCNHCPFVVHLADAIGAFAAELKTEGVGFVAINSNDTARYTADAPPLMEGFARQHGWKFPYLVDADQAVAKAHYAACTPDFYLFDAELRLVYCGQFDSSRPGNGKLVSGGDLRRAVQAMQTGEPPLARQQPSSGCNIKWLPGNEPDYFR